MAKKQIPSCGVLTGCDQNHEWLLKSWYAHFSKHSDLNVTFVDFGMSTSARIWCSKRGELLDMRSTPSWITPKEAIPEKQQKKWEKLYASTVWASRRCWLLKPIALAKTPYERSIWIDLDCVIRAPLTELIDKATFGDGFACAQEVDRGAKLSRSLGAIKPSWQGYNSGVVAFRKECPILAKWVDITKKENHLHMGDSDTLNHTLNESNFTFYQLPDKFNRRPVDGILEDTVIAHYVCTGGKHALACAFEML